MVKAAEKIPKKQSQPTNLNKKFSTRMELEEKQMELLAERMDPIQVKA